MLLSIKILPMFFALFLLGILARQIMIEPKKEFVFYEYVKANDIFKFIYSTRNTIEISLYDSENRFITQTTSKMGALYSKILSEGKVKMVIKNISNEPCGFAYKCPDPNKEVSGHLGYIKDTDLVSELTRLLDELISGQSDLIKRTLKHQEMVKKSRSWARLLMGFEFVMTGLAVYFLHKDFISVFEKKQTL